MVWFVNYQGPSWPQAGFLPIPPLTRSFVYKRTNCKKAQFLLALAWAASTHKSQGLTMDKVVVDVGIKETGCGCTYVALTRVRELNGFVFHPPFDFSYESLAKM